MFFTKYSLFCFFRLYIYFYFWFLFVCTLVYLHLGCFFEKSLFLFFKVICFIFGFCLCVLWFASLFFPLLFIEYFVFLFFKVILYCLIFGLCLCVLSVCLALLPTYFVYKIFLIFWNLSLFFGHLALPPTCLTHALLLEVLEHCIFSQDRHIVVTAKPLQTSTANTPGILEATTRPCHSGQRSPCFFISILPVHFAGQSPVCANSNIIWNFGFRIHKRLSVPIASSKDLYCNKKIAQPFWQLGAWKLSLCKPKSWHWFKQITTHFTPLSKAWDSLQYFSTSSFANPTKDLASAPLTFSLGDTDGDARNIPAVRLLMPSLMSCTM